VPVAAGDAVAQDLPASGQKHDDQEEPDMPADVTGPRPTWIPGHARRHQRCGDLDTRWMPACQCGWAFRASVRTLRIADRTHGFHLDRVHASRASADR
jgi:hypothetical protein